MDWNIVSDSYFFNKNFLKFYFEKSPDFGKIVSIYF